MAPEELTRLGAFGRPLYRFSILAVLWALILPAASIGQNLAPNPSFELISGTLPLNWVLCTGSGAGVLESVSTPRDQGTRSLRLTVNQTGDVGVCSDAIAVSPGVTFRLAARLSVNISPVKDKQARLQILELSGSDVQLASRVVATSLGRTSDWESLSGFFTTGLNTAKVKIRLLHDVPSSTGKFYWDSLSLQRDTAIAWERWERELTSSIDYSAGTNSNPYRDLRLTATFFRSTSCGTAPSSCTLPNCFQQAGFWDGMPGATGKAFKVRTALPAGNWCWKTACSKVGAAGATTPDCSQDSGLIQSGAINVTPYSGTNKLYLLGLPAPKVGGSFLVYGDKTTTFPWIADTAWGAPLKFSLPPLGSPPSTDLWKNYVGARAKTFTVLLVAPATQYLNPPASMPVPPASGFQGFFATAGCVPANHGVVPNECSYLDPAYWRKLDSMVKDANDAGIVVAVTGVIDPTDRGGPGTDIVPLQKYPRKDAAETFARQLAARLAGSFVFFSPGFDDRVNELLDDGLRVKDAMNAVGPVLSSAAPRHLIGNQLGGGSPLTDYDLFHAASWLSFEFYQSGHKGNQGSPCSYADGQEYARAVCRARELTLRFRCQGAASTVKNCPTSLPPGSKKPAVNSEGAYDDFATAPEDPDNRDGSRHTAYASALSGSFGFTIGIDGLYRWDNPGIYAASHSKTDDDLARMGGFFNGGPWTDFEPRHNLIANNPVVNTATTSPATTGKPPANERKLMLLAGNSSYALVYVPDVRSPFSGVQIKTANVSNALPGLSCSGWKKRWVNPRQGGQTVPVSCTSGNGFITISGIFTCPDSGACDWILQLSKGNLPPIPSSNFAGLLVENNSLDLNDLEVWTEISADSATSAVLAQVLDPDREPISEPLVVSPDGNSFQKLPLVVRDNLGTFFVTWEAENPITGFHEIFGRRYDNSGGALGDAFPVSGPAEGQQAEPSLTADPEGNVTVVWTRYGLEDESGSIEIQAYDTSGTPVGDTIDLPTDPGEDPMSALVQSDADGNLWVAWTTEGLDGSGGGVYAQRLLRGGTPVGHPLRVNTTRYGVRRIVALWVERNGSFRVVWEGLGPQGRGKGLRERRYDAKGLPLEEETSIDSLD